MHRYEITLWALATPKFSVTADAKATDLEESLTKVALARASLTGVVSR